jgi:hypothetical protein
MYTNTCLSPLFVKTLETVVTKDMDDKIIGEL